MQGKGSSTANRLDRLRALFPQLGVDAVLLLDLMNIRYLTGFTGSDGALLVGAEGTPTLLVDGRYVTQARGEIDGGSVVEYRDKREGIAAAVAGSGSRVAGFEAAVLNVDTYSWLKGNLSGVTLKPLSGEIANIRAVKDEEEIACIREAAACACSALSAVQDILRPGVREKDIALELEFRIKRSADDVAFPVIVASGENSALPHARPGTRRIADGDAVVIDYGAVVKGYHCDETWTCVVGHADQRQREVYELVRRAHDEALRAVRARVACREIDRIARSCIAGAGLDSHFSHGTGHGVGLAVHEGPRIAAQSEGTLAAGMVITVEPGIYFPGLWGMRIEDTVLVREEGYEVLTGMSKDFTVLQDRQG